MSGILLATHGGESGAGAARVASLLAQRLGVVLHTLAVLEPLPVIDYGFGPSYAPTAEEIEAARSALLDHAQSVNADVITLGSHGYGVWKRIMIGSVASKMIRLSTRAVLVAPLGCLSSRLSGSSADRPARRTACNSTAS